MPKSIFDIVGPIMIGPSSSHTAGAVRLGNLARRLFNQEVNIVDLYLHGSFKDTYKGHGTDKALIGGLLGFDTADERIRDAWDCAERSGLLVNIQFTDLGAQVHPNTVQFVLYDVAHNSMTIRGSSLGGGRVIVDSIDGFKVELNGEEHILIIYGIDRPGVISRVTGLFSEYDINIGTMHVARKAQGRESLMTLEIDSPLSEEVIANIKNIENVRDAVYIRPI